MCDKMYPRVAPGGLFHTRKVNYSPETQAFVKELLRESKLTIFQRKKLNETVKNGEPLPLPPSKTSRQAPSVRDVKSAKASFYDIPRRRRKDIISESGAYEREQFAPNYAKPNHDLEKKRLQDLMAFGKTINQDKSKTLAKMKEKHKTRDDIDILLDNEKMYTETLKDVKERLDFLKFMEENGHKKAYDPMMKQEIAAKLRQLENMDESLKADMRKEYNEVQDKAAYRML